MRRPSFFLSSTIFDFRDLRSAVKYLLEELGCSVLASEYNDFPKPLDTHSYEACLSAMHKADYFVLFIGNRVGGWYDEVARVSITQQEYREAYKLHLEGKLKLMIFVRSDVWRLREDRKDLAKFLEDLDLDPGVKLAIKYHPSKSVADAQFIISFIEEVSRNKETKAAVTNNTEKPTGNWVHVFETFRDVADVIQTETFSGIPIEHLTLRRLLLRELLEVLRSSLAKFKENHVYSPKASVLLFHKEHKLTLEGREHEYTEVNVKRWDMLSTFGIHLLSKKFSTQILQRALESAAFLTYDNSSGSFKEDPVYDALYQLNEEIRRINYANISETLSVIFTQTPRLRPHGSSSVSIETFKLLPFLHLMDRWINIIDLSRAIASYLQGNPFTMPRLRPQSPIPDMNEQLEQESVTLLDVNTFIVTGG